MNQKKEQKQEEATFDFSAQSEEFLGTFFRKGAMFTEQLIQDTQRMRNTLTQLSEENGRLRSQLASDDAVKDLLTKIKLLEDEKTSIREDVQQVTREFKNHEVRYTEMEHELDQMANLYVASSQLHATMDASEVFSVIEQMLLQFVGVAKMGIFVRSGDDGGNSLKPVHAFHCDEIVGTEVSLDASVIGETVVSGVNHVADPDKQRDKSEPIVCIPMLFGGQAIGAIAIYDLLEQKDKFVDVDFELFKLLSMHSASAIIGAGLFEGAGSVNAALSNVNSL